MSLSTQNRRTKVVISDDSGVFAAQLAAEASAAAAAADATRAETAADRIDLGDFDADVAATAAAAAAAAASAAEAATESLIAENNAATAVLSAASADADAVAAALSAATAESARDAALLANGVYETTAAALAVLSVGDFFSVPTGVTGEFIQLYQVDTGPVATPIGDPYPSLPAIENKPDATEGDDVAVTRETGIGQVINSQVFRDVEGALNVGPTFKVSRATGTAQIVATDEATGIGVVIGQPNADTLDEASGSDAAALFTAAEYQYAEDRALAEALRLNSQDVTGFAKRAIDAAAARVLRIGTGQSFMAGSGQARLFLSASRMALLGYTSTPALSVGPDSRCVNDGPTYVTFGGGSLTLTPLVEHFIAQTNTDLIHTNLEVSTGDYAYNARGGTPETVRDVLSWVLRNRWHGLADTDLPAWTTVAMNHAKTDGSIAEVGSGDGLLRLYSLVDVFVSATSGTRYCDVIDFNHGEADEAAATATYAADVVTYADAIWTNLQLDLSQTDRPAFLYQQVGGPRYGTAAMVCANAQVEQMLDLTGTEASMFMVGVKYEVPSVYFYDQADYSGFPDSSIWDNNGHPTLAGNVLMGIRSAIGLHYIQDREEPYWVPFPFECYFSANKFLLSIPSKFPPLRAVDMVCGVETYMLDSLGITFESGGGSDNPVTFARVVDGYKTLIEGECSDDIAGFTTMKAGKRTGPLAVTGFTNIRDSFLAELPFDLPFDRNQTIFPLETRDNPTLNGLGRWIEDIPGWVGKPDLGNPCARRTLTAIPMPAV